MAQTIDSGLRWWAKATPDAIALASEGDRLTYREYDAWTSQVAAWLAAKDVDHGDRVGICASNSLEYCVLVLACIRAGAIAVPLSTRHTAHELSLQIDDFRPRLIVASVDQFAKLEEGGLELVDIAALGELRRASPVAFERKLDPNAAVVIISTSGSTARPKGVVHSHLSMIAYATSLALEDVGHVQGARVLAAAPMSTSSGLVKLLQYATVGASLFFEPKFEAERFLSLLVEEKITTFGGTPIFWDRIAGCPGFEAADLSHLRTCMTGGASVPPSLLQRWLSKGILIRQLYGQTECVGAITLTPRELAVEFPEKCGRGGIFTEIATIDADGNRTPVGVPGEIILRGPTLMKGYWNNPDATAEVMMPDGWMRTGDMGVLDEQGHLTFVSRLKDIIISGGLNISAAEVERVIGEIEDVLEVVVFGMPDPKFGETPMAVVHSTREIAADMVVEHCRGKLADYKVPRYLAFEADPLPRTPTGKFAKPPLREKYESVQHQLRRVR